MGAEQSSHEQQDRQGLKVSLFLNLSSEGNGFLWERCQLWGLHGRGQPDYQGQHKRKRSDRRKWIVDLTNEKRCLEHD